jgi:hypothetical protein
MLPCTIATRKLPSGLMRFNSLMRQWPKMSAPTIIAVSIERLMVWRRREPRRNRIVKMTTLKKMMSAEIP